MNKQPIILIAGTPDNCHILTGNASVAPDGSRILDVTLPNGNRFESILTPVEISEERTEGGYTITAKCGMYTRVVQS